MTELVRYEAARAALAAARTTDEVLSVRNTAERMQLYARQANDRELMADAAEIRQRATRQLGVMLVAAKDAGQLVEGRRRKVPENCTEPEQFQRVTLDELNIDRKLSAVAQKIAKISDRVFDAIIANTRERILSDKAKIIQAPTAHGASRVTGADDLDYSPTCPWATRALIEHVFPALGISKWPSTMTAWEPACGEGHIAEVLREYFADVFATDIHDYGYGAGGYDFLHRMPDPPGEIDFIITNPPFEDRVLKFMLRALELSRIGVAMFLQLRYLEGLGRYREVFSKNPPTIVAPFVERVPLLMGYYDPDASTTTAFMWLVWIKDMEPKPTFWIPPGCRESLTRPDDAERFTAHPVIKRDHAHMRADDGSPTDVTTGEILDTPQAQCEVVA